MEKNVKVYWVVIILIATIFIFYFIQTGNKNNDLVQYLSFAGSITSLILGVIAIFYSIITNQQSTENFGKLKEAVTKIEEGARIINEVSSNINSKLDKISDEIGTIKIASKANPEQVVSASSFTSDKEAEVDGGDNPPGEEPSKNEK